MAALTQALTFSARPSATARSAAAMRLASTEADKRCFGIQVYYNDTTFVARSGVDWVGLWARADRPPGCSAVSPHAAKRGPSPRGHDPRAGRSTRSAVDAILAA